MEIMVQENVKVAFRKQYQGPFSFYGAPGRINLIGEHTDYNQGLVLPAAIDKRMYLAIQPNKSNRVEITALDFNETVSFKLQETSPELPHWALYPYGTLREMEKDGLVAKGFNAVFAGDIPVGAGLSSSAALESVFAVALNDLFQAGFDKMQLALAGQRAEHHYAGVQCGIMDQFASIFGKKNHVVLLDCRNLEHQYFPLNIAGYQLILADTRVKHSLASSKYNERRYQCEEGLELLKTRLIGIKSLRDVRSKNVLPYEGLLGKEIALRCKYVTEEIERVEMCCEALNKTDLNEVGRLMFATHHGLSSDYMVSCGELDLLVKTASRVSGVAGSRMMGGGFGGCTINLVAEPSVETFKQQLSEAFHKTYGSLPEFYDVNTSDGAGLISREV